MTATITDLFCGAGGSSIGAEMAGAELRLALNHWERAIETHATNFQHADHDCNDVAALTTAQIRRYPHTDILLASPECTNHSLAKGARRRKPQAASLWEDGPSGDKEQDRSRATMFDVWRFAEQKQIAGHPYKVPGTAYEVLGNKRERMAQYGNAVTPPAMELLVGRLLEVIG